MSEVLSDIKEEIAKNEDDGFEVIQIDLSFDSHEELKKYMRESSGLSSDVVVIDKLFGLPVVVRQYFPNDKKFALWIRRMEKNE